MLAATEKLDFMPSEAKPTGARLDIPENGISATVDTSELVVAQELPESSGKPFLEICTGLASLANRCFTPTGIVKNGLASKSIWPMSEVEAVLASTLKLGDTIHTDLAKVVGMVPAYKSIDCNFSSGNLELHVVVQAVTFEKVSFNRHTAGFRASASQKRRVERLNKAADRFDDLLHHALMLEVDLIELDPPKTSLQDHFRELNRYTDALRTRFALP
ncbi:MAG: hypothetical protein ABSH38_14610 [Verrucomicrobiota bacterium]|jgi:hypothetical protein